MEMFDEKKNAHARMTRILLAATAFACAPGLPALAQQPAEPAAQDAETIESVIVSVSNGEDETRLTAPPDSTPWLT